MNIVFSAFKGFGIVRNLALFSHYFYVAVQFRILGR